MMGKLQAIAAFTTTLKHVAEASDFKKPPQLKMMLAKSKFRRTTQICLA